MKTLQPRTVHTSLGGSFSLRSDAEGSWKKEEDWVNWIRDGDRCMDAADMKRRYAFYGYNVQDDDDHG